MVKTIKMSVVIRAFYTAHKKIEKFPGDNKLARLADFK